jgi:hypothetical protein
VTDEARYEAMRSAAMAWAEGFSWQRTADRLLELALESASQTVRVGKPRAAVRAE